MVLEGDKILGSGRCGEYRIHYFVYPLHKGVAEFQIISVNLEIYSVQHELH